MSRTRTPVVADWFSGEGEDFRLLGTRCGACGSVFFPREDSFCRNPGCTGGELAEVPLSKRGRIWSYTDGRYRPPLPYVSDPDAEWEPYTLLAVELEDERMVVLGQAVPGVTTAELEVGMEVEAVPGVLNEEAGTTWTTWHFKPVSAR
ncbi:Zn-ribbon domain-containing OB-fold protein [Streptomyces mesophilus]|uniref:Zn-ribbon domain-containing OB-fold protein n=1 Tax=Streptomyces mesophilus TaxID=1775132 RepID=UPI0019D1382E|nr:zinc ribbon domain-containing protein [Streptomyces mesophilus]